MKRRLGRSNLDVSALGLGCWAIGGAARGPDGQPIGWGDIDDNESIRAIHAALDRGVTFIDTASSYGAGHSEQVVGRALRGRRDEVILATKFGNVIDEAAGQMLGRSADLDHIRTECDSSLRRLQTDRIDLYQFHHNWYDGDPVPVRELCEELVAAGKIRWYGWSTDHPELAEVFAAGTHCATIQHRLNVLQPMDEMLELCDRHNLASINKSPLATGLLSGKFNPDTTFPANDLRHRWNFREGPQAELLQQLEALRDALTVDGRTLVQGALAWIWARSNRTLPIPGFRSFAQIEENVSALDFGPLTDDQMRRIENILGR